MNWIDKSNLFDAYENNKLISHTGLSPDSEGVMPYNALPEQDACGLPVMLKRYGNELHASFTPDTHCLVIGATRSGKTTGYIIPTIFTLAKRRNKSNMLISDPKCELYISCSGMLRDQGYRVILLNFRDFCHSEYWNPFTPLYRKFVCAHKLEEEVGTVNKDGKYFHTYKGAVFPSHKELMQVLDIDKEIILDEVESGIDELADTIMTVDSLSDPYWETSARDVFKGLLYALLEDSLPRPERVAEVTEDNFSLRTLCSLAKTLHPSFFNSDPFFTSRPHDSAALKYLNPTIIRNSDKTAMCIWSSFNAKISIFTETISRKVTGCNTFELSELSGESGNVAVFVSYKDETSVSYKVIQLFVKAVYTELLGIANSLPTLALKTPFYFLLDEFGNFPPIKDFQTTISACGSRNIWMVLVLQSYAQLYQSYGDKVGDIIKDNLNMHVFLGTNNPKTKQEFSEECGLTTIISPLSALNGEDSRITRFERETVPLVPVSSLNCFSPGECIITIANSTHVFRSKIERSYTAPEFSAPRARIEDYRPAFNIYDPRYSFTVPPSRRRERTMSLDF